MPLVPVMGSFFGPVKGPGSQVPRTTSIQDLGSQLPPSNFMVLGHGSGKGARFRVPIPTSKMCPMVLGHMSHLNSWISGPTFWICHFII